MNDLRSAVFGLVIASTLIGVTGCSSSGDDSGISNATSASATLDDTPSSYSSTTTTTTVPSSSTTTAAPSSSTTTTVPPLQQRSEDEYRSSFVAAWESGVRSDFVDLLADNTNVQSVDLVDFDASTDTLIVDITSAWASDERREDAAWELTRAIAVLWEGVESGSLRQPTWSPSFRLVNSGKLYECTAAFMQQIADVRASRADWAANCLPGSVDSEPDPTPTPDPEVDRLRQEIAAQMTYVEEWRVYVASLQADAALLVPDLERRIAEADAAGAVNGAAALRVELEEVLSGVAVAEGTLRTEEVRLADLQADLAART